MNISTPRRQFTKRALASAIASLVRPAWGRNPRGGAGGVGGGGATLVFSYPSGFAGASGQIRAAWEAAFVGSTIELCSTGATHEAGNAWYIAQQNISSFTTNFTIQQVPAPANSANNVFDFVIQTTTTTTNPGAFGTNAGGDANMGAYGAYSNQTPQLNSVAIVFDASAANNDQRNWNSNSSAIQLAINGGAYAAFTPTSDVEYALNMHTGNIFAVNIVYDGTILTMTMKDTVTLAQVRMRWPINIPQCMQGGSNMAWIGLGAGMVTPVYQNNLLTWDFSNGYDTRLAMPTFSVTPGQYASTQSVALSGPSGASIRYTINGVEPTPASTLYAGTPISVSSSTIIKATSSQPNFTDSYTAVGNYQIQTAGQPLINLPSGFASAGNLIQYNGYCFLNGSAAQMTDTTSDGQASAIWYAAPVGCGTFTTDLTLTFGAGTSGMTFCLQNQNPTPAYSLAPAYISGGMNAVGNNGSGMGYSGISNGTNGQISGLKSSVCVAFNSASNTVGVFTNGVDISTGGTSITGITLTSGHAMSVVLSYNGTTLSGSITDTVTTVNFPFSFNVNIPAAVGGSTAFAGVTAGTGQFSNGNQKVTAWTYATP